MANALTACHLANDRRWVGCPTGQTGRNVRSHTLLQHYVALGGNTTGCLAAASVGLARPPVHLVLVVREPLAQVSRCIG